MRNLEKLNKEQEYGLAIANKILSLFSEGDYSLEELDATKFFTGMVLGCNLVFRKLTQEDISTLEFTYKLNQLVVQYFLENKGRCSK